MIPVFVGSNPTIPVWVICFVAHDVFSPYIRKPTSGRLLRIVTRSGGILWMVHSITVKTDTKEILSKCKVASAGSDARIRCAWIVCKRVSKRSKKTGSALQGSSPCLSTLRKAIRSLGPIIDMLQAEMTVKNFYSW